MQWVEIPHGMHMDMWLRGGDKYWRSIANFVRAYAPLTEAESQQPDALQAPAPVAPMDARR